MVHLELLLPDLTSYCLLEVKIVRLILYLHATKNLFNTLEDCSSKSSVPLRICTNNVGILIWVEALIEHFDVCNRSKFQAKGA